MADQTYEAVRKNVAELVELHRQAIERAVRAETALARARSDERQEAVRIAESVKIDIQFEDYYDGVNYACDEIIRRLKAGGNND